MKKSTRDVHSKSLFRAHGRADYEVQGRVVHVRAVGPFNAEFVPAVNQTIAPLIAALAESGNWAQIITFHHSAMCSPVAMTDFAESLKARYTNPATKPVVALVMGPDVEGGGLMRTVICKAYHEAGVECCAFTDGEEALAWARARLA